MEKHLRLEDVASKTFDTYRWGIVFLISDTRLTDTDRDYIVLLATEMYFLDETERSVKTDTFEGRIYTSRKYDCVGTLKGQRFDAEIETGRGKANLRFLVDERTGEQYQASKSVH